MKNRVILPCLCLGFAAVSLRAEEPRQISGIYPSLAMFNNEGECGTGAVVPWADRLWVITYGPHLPFGSSDKLYEITPDLQQVIRPESLGGTPANRMIHTETQQLLIGPYVIDAERQVRVIPPAKMPGRLTGNARHLVDPAGKAYYATMEEGLYEVDLKTLEVTGLIQDGNTPKPGFSKEEHPATVKSELSGYHGKGLFSGQGRLVYANNGDRDKRVTFDPATPSGALGEWTAPGDDWRLVRRNQFTEVSGPGGLHGNANPETDPIWSVGWDHRSLILMCLHEGKWHSYRLPKSSHSYDGAHGWNTEWPRIRDIGETDLLMTMHGAFWRFPKSFTPVNSMGITPRSNYLKVIGDFARWQDRIVFGCDDSANKEFLNVRKAKGELAGPGQSQSNLWFVEPGKIDQFGPVIGRGAVWLEDAVKAGEVSEPFLFAGYKHRSLHLTWGENPQCEIEVEIDRKGNGQWETLRVSSPEPKQEHVSVGFEPEEVGVWVRVKCANDCPKITAMFHYRNDDPRTNQADELFEGIARVEDADLTGGLLLARGGGLKTLRFISSTTGNKASVYDMGAAFDLEPVEDPQGLEWTSKKAAIPEGVLTYDEASIVYVDHKGRWRLPRGDKRLDKEGPLGAERVCREVCTERDLFNAGGTFFELPAENAGGFAKIRPIATHNRRIKDYASYRGLMVLSGVRSDAAGEHIVRSNDGETALWVGAVDDLWKFGKVRGEGGPWLKTAAKAGVPSDPYLCTGYDRKRLTLAADKLVQVTVEADISGTGLWVPYQVFNVQGDRPTQHTFPAAFSPYWLRFVASEDAVVSAQLVYD
jgi:hypothetical protein